MCSEAVKHDDWKWAWVFIITSIIIAITTVSSHCQVYVSSFVYRHDGYIDSIEYDSCYVIAKRPSFNNDTITVTWLPPDTYYPTTFVFVLRSLRSTDVRSGHRDVNRGSIMRSYAMYGIADLHGEPYQIITYEHENTFQLWITPLKFTRLHNLNGRRGFYFSDEVPGKSYPNCKY